MIHDLFYFHKKSRFMAGYRLFSLFIMLILTVLLAGCNTSDDSGDDDGDASTGVWTLISRYFYDYNADDQLIRETDDNNANNIIDTGDVTWEYEYDSDGLRTGYLMFEGADLDEDGIGTYFYDSNDCNYRLEEETPQGTNLQVWTYSVDSDCTRTSYYYDGNGTTETGTYTRDENGNVTKLTLDNGDYWEYDLDTNGERIGYDFYQGGTLVRYGIYYYTGGLLDELRNYEKR